MRLIIAICLTFVLLPSFSSTLLIAQKNVTVLQTKKPKKPAAPFAWVNPLKGKYEGVLHKTFRSPSMKKDVGYCIHLPPGYDTKSNKAKKYPVIYYLHGGRPGSELKGVKLAEYIHPLMKTGKVAPMIHVFVNGGPVSHYNLPERKDAMGEDVFIKELIPHIDATYRTIAHRQGRGIEGFSQGGRGTARIMFKYPDLFCTAAPGGGGMATEKRISQNHGEENPQLIFAEGYNTWDLAKVYARKKSPSLKILVYVGTKDFNYNSNLEWMKHLDSLSIPYQKIIGEGIPHSGQKWYQTHAEEILNFHARNFKEAGATK